MAEVFLSYAREDVAIARQVAERLREEGWSVFWDREVPVGGTWENVIEQQLARASCVVVLWSSASVASDWVRAEAAVAAERGALVPALIDPTNPPARFRMIQTADLVGWQGRGSQVGLANLIAAVRALAGSGRKPNSEESAGQSDAIRRSAGGAIAIAEIETGEDRGRSLVLTESTTSVTFGRSRDCDFVLDDFYISRSHCRLEVQPIKPGPAEQGRYRFVLIDFGSLAGTMVNNKRIDRVDLQNGDHFQIGSVRFRFRILDEGAA
jgi:TIR domain/FHA domain